eukprot:CAMPEP_0185593796 /NCGR_PEP_ID=MMETSP0434-20130131/72702_1 /TAXON_ID=626734 ORGANISM="Favella taraikaensis, Strain Fe Narragansett Bay" /NCGR_SAMPLE_ID=MMETSP0434 /ASSEMBLY_ACC=CAM_ASM_000379 /LENGTH=30 /DNA_ID= /DNA_START= /DNA_END= /DNA_ORIENTATION=
MTPSEQSAAASVSSENESAAVPATHHMMAN